MKKKIISLFMVTTLLSTTVVLPVFAEEGSQVIVDEDVVIDDNIVTTEFVGIDLTAENSNASVDAQDVTVNHNGDNVAGGICADAGSGISDAEAYVGVNNVNVTTKDTPYTVGIQTHTVNDGKALVEASGVTVKSDAVPAPGVGVYTFGVESIGNNGKAYAYVNDDINVTGSKGATFGIKATADGADGISGVISYGNINVTGQALSTGIYAVAEKGASAAVLSGDEDSKKMSVHSTQSAFGVFSVAQNGSLARILSDSELSVYSDMNAIGIRAETHGSDNENEVRVGELTVNSTNTVGIAAGVYGGSNNNTHVEVRGNVSAKGAGARGVSLVSDGMSTGSHIVVGINGDLISDGTGINARNLNGVSSLVFVDGTLSAGDGPAVVFNGASANDLKVTAWKVESANSELVMEKADDGSLVRSEKAKELEKAINYVICFEPGQEHNISTIYGANDFVYETLNLEKERYSYKTATEGTKVGIKLEIPDGYKLGGVYSDEERTTSLLVDDEGNYYLIVPKGGGVTVNMLLIPIEDDDDNKKSEETVASNDNNYVAPQGSFVVSNGMAMATIAPGTDTISMTSAELLSYLAMGAQSFMITTPAGTFNIPLDAELLAILRSAAQIRFVLNGGALEIYVDGQTTPVKVVSL